jgi:HSP20 family molecular chaperone IbpA
MTRVSLLSSPFLLGFDHLERVLERAAKSADDGYPPYNIEQVGESHWRVVLAVAGLLPDQLNVTLEDSQLVVSGAQQGHDKRAFMHRGIAARQFQRRFVLADGVEVIGASLEHGLLNINLERPETTPLVQRIKIRTV